MSVNADRIRQCLQAFDFKKLFIQELGWDKHSAHLPVAVDGAAFTLQAVAEKRGMQVFEYTPSGAESFPNYDVRRKIERQVAKRAHEHIIIHTDADKTVQKWQWVRREPGQPLACRELGFEKGQTGESLVQKLQVLAVDLAEEESVSLVDVTRRARQAFDVDRVTKRFYDRFKTEHSSFLKFLKGVAETADREWYASLMLNRLMFIYFIQKKGFLDGDLDYLRNRLRRLQENKGRDKFHTFYRYFLLRLFHEGLAQPKDQRKQDLNALLGEAPYLNGGLFDVHTLEEANPEIQIADEAFERLFTFFDAYHWHLDERPLRADNEINPDVLGYIFEKYINQKQMGAYYTKEDVTGYIARNTIIPFLFNAAEKRCAIAFHVAPLPPAGEGRGEGLPAVWRLLRDDPNRYIYPAVGHSIFCDANQKPPRKLDAPLPLPPAVVEGVNDIAKRKGWNGPATPEYALPTETWREVVARRQRCEELQKKLQAGEIHCINDLITYNLDICQFASDVIENCEGPELLRAFWKAIESVSVLDPACGSGAFLFAALNILEPLYEACLRRMQAFLDDLARLSLPSPSGRGDGSERKPPHLEKFSDFRKTLEEVARHPNRRYFVLKSIIINNLYGVDLMEEAVEICKLRLFLKLVAQVDKVKHLEPLPDIDFNIRPGNTLVGFASLDDVKKTLEGKLGFGKKQVERISEDADVVDRQFKMFREMQTEQGMDAKKFAGAKAELRTRLDKLRVQLDQYLAGEYQVEADKPEDFQACAQSVLPFHWFAEFYGIMHNGGFDVIIGNPPYISAAKVRGLYTLRDYKTAACSDIYANFQERNISLLMRHGRCGMIVPLSLSFSSDFQPLRTLLLQAYSHNWFSSYGRIPSSLFSADVRVRNTIHLGARGIDDEPHVHYTSVLHRWFDACRPFLMGAVRYSRFEPTAFDGLIPKINTQALRACPIRGLKRLIDSGTRPLLLWVASD